MPTYSVTLETTPELSELVSFQLWELGAQGVEVRDGEDLPMPGFAPPEGRVVLVGWFRDGEAAAGAAESLGGVATEIKEQDWSETWKEGLGTLTVGRVFVRPSWIEAAVPSGTVEVVLDPGMAFGSGSHPSTALCLAALSRVLAARPGAAVLDVGTGSGLLAIAARKLGAARVLGVDNDPVAVAVARENATRNGAVVQISRDPLAAISGRFDVVVANILANTLVELAPEIASHLATHGVAMVAGVLGSQEEEVRSAYSSAGLFPLENDD